MEAGALLLAISEGRPSHAAVDVYEEEPIWSAAHPLFKFTNVLPTPHIGYVEKNTYEVYFSDAFVAVNAFAKNQPIRLVD